MSRNTAAAIAVGDAGGLGAAFDEFAQDLYAYCRFVLVEPEETADAVQDVFIIAAARVPGLSQPGRLRAWLFAVARNECHRRLRARAQSAPLYEAAFGETAEMAAVRPADPGSRQPAEPRAVMSTALAGLSAGDREICELNLRHELNGADLASVLGVPRNQAQTLAARACTQLETSLGVILATRSGRQYCPDLAASLAGRGRTLTGLRRVRVRRHIERCPVCREQLRRNLSSARLFSLLPGRELPPDLRSRLLRRAASLSPEAAAYRGEVTCRAEPFATSGFPVQIAVPSAPRLDGVHAMAAIAAVVAVGVLVSGIFYVNDASASSSASLTTFTTVAPATPAPSTQPATTQAPMSPWHR